MAAHVLSSIDSAAGGVIKANAWQYRPLRIFNVRICVRAVSARGSRSSLPPPACIRDLCKKRGGGEKKSVRCSRDFRLIRSRFVSFTDTFRIRLRTYNIARLIFSS